MSESSKAVVLEYFRRLDTDRRLPLDLVTDDFVFHIAGTEPQELSVAEPFSRAFFATIPDLMHPLDEVISEGDTVAFRYHYEGTHTQEVIGAAPTGNAINYQGMGFMHVRDRKVSDFYVVPDRVTFMKQLGQLPEDA